MRVPVVCADVQGGTFAVTGKTGIMACNEVRFGECSFVCVHGDVYGDAVSIVDYGRQLKSFVAARSAGGTVSGSDNRAVKCFE
jgi:hypothetical protein